MKTETQHTPTPKVRFAEDTSTIPMMCIGIENKCGEYALTLEKGLNHRSDVREQLQSIVRAVNSHEALIKACRRLLCDLEYRKVESTAAMDLARRVIAKTEGK